MGIVVANVPRSLLQFLEQLDSKSPSRTPPDSWWLVVFNLTRVLSDFFHSRAEVSGGRQASACSGENRRPLVKSKCALL
jgi:hypothetical protein